MSMAHMMGERGDSGRYISRRAAFSQTAGQEIWRPCSDDRDPLPDPTQSQELRKYLAPLSLSELSVFVSTGQADRKRTQQSGRQQSSDDDDEHPFTSSSSKSSSMDSRSSEQGRSDSFDWSCPPLPGQVPVEPTETSNGRTVQGAMVASPLNKLSTGQADRKRTKQSSRQQSSDDDEHPFTSSSSSSKSSCMDSGHSRSSEQGRSDSFDWSCPPLPGQVPVEPTETSNGRTVQGAMEASPLNKIATGQADRKRTQQSGRQQSSDDDDEHPFTSSSSKSSSMDSGHSRSSEQGGSDSFDWSCPPLPGQVPVEPTETSNGRTVQGAMEASPLNRISTGQADRTQQSSSQQSLDDDEYPFTSSSSLSKSSSMDSSHSRSRRTASTDSSPGIVSSSSSSSSSSLSLSSRGSYNVIWRWSGDGSDSRSEQGRSDSLEWSSSPLPGQVPVEPTETSNSRTVQGAMEASPLKKISTEKPAECGKGKGIRSFFKRLWKAMKCPVCCCCLSSAVDVVEPFFSDPEPSSSTSDHSGIKPNDESFESLYKVGEMIGSGGFGSVYKGTRKFDGKRVAIKQIQKIKNNRYLYIPGHPKPLVTEVALLLMMRRKPISPLIIQLYEWFEHPGKFTLVMEFPEPCMSLRDYINRTPVLYEPTARFIMRQALLAVQVCIKHGVFHNDIHAQNFLLKESTLELKLIDFGCGQLFSSDGYESRTYAGVLKYCPPEVLTEPRFHAVPANVWALGVLLYTMVHACPPFRNESEIRRANITFPNYNLSKRNNILPVLGGGLELET
ncbi:uncharacterized protein [Pseudorasbora parva]|uniref:uncharacterized protein isoform X2 n=1 Tax=Pseudorasbora parva TaxID=51549 RepID=UPI00351F18DA